MTERHSACLDDLGCQLNGRCIEGRCFCDAGWRGYSCGELALGRSMVVVRYKDSPAAGGAWTWGGSPIVDDKGLWHLFFSAMVNGCGLLHYQTNSVVKHAVANTLDGPWTVVTTALAPRHGGWDSGGVHAPSVSRDPRTKRFLLFYEATHSARSALDCRANSSVPAVYISRTRRIGVASAISPYGPWQRLDRPILAPRPSGSWDDTDVSNAAPLLLPNGSVLLAYRAGGDGVSLGGGMGIAAAPAWDGPYRRVGLSVSRALFAAEDGALYMDRRKRFHMLVHRFAALNGSTAGSAVGGHAWSLDGIEWHFDQDSVAYTTAVSWQNGSHSSLYRRERPKPVVDDRGQLAELFNGAWPCHRGTQDDDTLDSSTGCYSFTMRTRVENTTSLMLCNAGVSAAGNSTITFRIAHIGATPAIRFGECAYLTAQVGAHVAEVASSDGARGSGKVVALASPGRSYAVAYLTDTASLQLISPSSSFNEDLPVGWDRFVWASLCPMCDEVAAWVSGYQKQINPTVPMACCGSAVDETEGPPGPPKGAVGMFTTFRPSGVPGEPLAPICFPWTREEYDGRGEPFQMLLGPNLTMTILFGHAPVIYGKGHEQSCPFLPPPRAAPTPPAQHPKL